MNRIGLVLAAVLLLTAGTGGAVEKVKAKPAESFWDKFLRITGISATPSTSKEGQSEDAGDIWIGEIGGVSRLRLTSTGDYRSPIFSADGREVFALRGNPPDAVLVRIGTSGGDEPITVRKAPRITQLVAVDREESNSLVVLTGVRGASTDLALLSIDSDRIQSLHPEPADKSYTDALALAARWDRRYSVPGFPSLEVTVRPTPAGELNVPGAQSGTDVFVNEEAGEPVNLSRCRGDRCLQPALSPDGKLVAFVRIEGAL
jgi:hypothetical protein